MYPSNIPSFTHIPLKKSKYKLTNNPPLQQGVGVEIIRVLPESPAPALSNLFCNSEEFTPEEMVITCDCDAQPVLQIKTFRQKSGKIEVGHYKVTVARLRCRLSAPINYNTLRGEMKMDGFPDVSVLHKIF